MTNKKRNTGGIGMLDKLRKRIRKTVGPSLAVSLEPLAHIRNEARFFYRYYFGRCLSELAQLAPLPYSRRRFTCYSDSDRLHDFLSCYKNFHVDSFVPRTARLEFSAYRIFSFHL